MLGLDPFKRLLAEFGGLSIWATGAAVAVPFAAALVDLSPPWPPGIVLVTGIAELLVLALVYQSFSTAGRRRIQRVMIRAIVGLALAALAYLVLLSLFTYEVPTTGERFVKGFECTPAASAVFAEACPDLGREELRTAEFEAENLWTRGSIATMRVLLVVLWSATFVRLSLALGSFLVFQLRATLREEGARPRSGSA